MISKKCLVVQYEGAPSFTDIINCACDTSDRSSKSYKRFAKDVKERLIECMFISSVFIVITLGVIAILCVLMLLGVFVCIFDHDDNHKNDKNSKEH